MLCVRCGRIIEFLDERIDQHLREVVERNGFSIVQQVDYKLTLYELIAITRNVSIRNKVLAGQQVQSVNGGLVGFLHRLTQSVSL